jgi:hypothetical protein
MCVEPVTLNRRATDKDEPSNRMILTRLEQFIAEHEHEHKDLDKRLSVQDVAAALRERSILELQRGAPEISELHDFRIQVETIGASVKWILGGSLIAALAAIASLIATFSHIVTTVPK